MENKFKQLQNKLSSISFASEQQNEPSSKVKIRNVQQLLKNLQQKYEEQNVLYEHKVNVLFENLRKIDNSVKDSTNEVEIEQSNWNSKVAKMDKNIKKVMEKISKERKQSDKKIQSTLETHLIELTSFKGKASSSCQASIRQSKQLEKDVEHLEREIKRESQLSQDIYKKIYAQFSTQIEEIRSSLANEERERQEQSERIFDSIMRVYNNLSGSIVQGTKSRERHERQIVDLLERVIEKLKYELLND